MAPSLSCHVGNTGVAAVCCRVHQIMRYMDDHVVYPSYVVMSHAVRACTSAGQVWQHPQPQCNSAVGHMLPLACPSCHVTGASCREVLA